MKFTAEVKAALATLRNAAENDFERHRIDVLERDLTAPPKVEIIDDKSQKFNGILYYKDRTGHCRSTSHIHRAVWVYYRGEIPDNHEIHHIDKIKDNNDISNLQCLTKSEHQKLHKKKGTPAAYRDKNPIVNCRHCGKPFKTPHPNSRYCSDECRIKHDLIYKICPICGKSFSVPHKHKNQICCSLSCGQRRKNQKKF